MSLAKFTTTCSSCGAEESLDGLLMRMIDDDQVRRLIADVLTLSLALGSLTLRYLRLHKPPKQKMRLEKVANVLGELLPDMQRHAITRHGREWVVPVETWKLGIQAVFDAAEKGSLTLPLDGNAYLYQVLMRMVDKAEGEAERNTEATKRQGTRSYADGPAVSAADALNKQGSAAPAAPPAAPPRVLITEALPPSRYAQKIKAELEARKQLAAAEPADQQ